MSDEQVKRYDCIGGSMYIADATNNRTLYVLASDYDASRERERVMREALLAILPFIPKSTAREGGAASYSENVRAADMVRAAIAATEEPKP